MTTMNLESILRQDDWLRRMAHGLVSEPELADDLAQDAWVADLEGSEHARSRKAWLRGVLRNAGSRAFRAKRAERDRAIDRTRHVDSSAPPTDDVAAQRELRRRVGRELLALPAREREALLLVYVADLPLNEAAARMKVSPSTAHRRVKAGLVNLRARVDRADRDDPRSWSVALTLLTRMGGARNIAAVTRTTGLVLGVSTALALITGIMVSRGGSQVEGPGPDAHLVAAPTNDAATIEDSFELASPARTRSLRSDAASRIQRRQDGDGDELARISARFLAPDGSLAEGAHWSLRGEPVDRSMDPDSPTRAEWKDLDGVIGEDGRLEIRFDPPRAYRFRLSVTHPGCARAAWRFSRVNGSTEKVFGTVRLDPECKIIGRIVDRDGEPLAGTGWSVSASEHFRSWSRGRVEMHTHIDVAVGQETFEVRGLSAGNVTLTLSPTGERLVDRFKLLLEDGAPLERDFIFDPTKPVDPRPTLLIRDRLFGWSQEIPKDRMTAVDQDGESVPMTPVSGSGRQWRVGSGSERYVRMTIDDPRFEYWESGLIGPGGQVTASLNGNSSIKLSIRDASGVAVELYSVALRQAGRSEPTTVHSGEFPLDEDVLECLVAGTYDVIVRADGAVGRVDRFMVRPGSTHEIDIVLRPKIRVTGSVTFPDGEPVDGAEIWLLECAQQDDSRRSPILRAPPRQPRPRFRIVRDTTKSGGRGTFALDVQSPGQYALKVVDPNRTWTVSEAFEIESNDVRHDIVLPRGAMLTGHIKLPDVLPHSDWEVHFVREDYAPHVDPTRPKTPILDDEGAFDVTGLQAGRTRVFLRRARSFFASGSGGIPIGAFEVGSVDLEEGAHHEASFALIENVPGVVSFAIELDREVEGRTVAVLSPTHDRIPWTSWAIWGAGTELPTDVIPADEYALHIKGDGWAVLNTPLITLPEGEKLEIPIERSIHEHRVRFMKGGKPITSGQVSIWKSSRSTCEFDVDGDGWATLALDRGTFHVSDGRRGRIRVGFEPDTTMAWPPVRDEVHFD